MKVSRFHHKKCTTYANSLWKWGKLNKQQVMFTALATFSIFLFVSFVFVVIQTIKVSNSLQSNIVNVLGVYFDS